MSTSLSVTSSNRVRWALSEVNVLSPTSREYDDRGSQTVANGTGPGQANIAHSEQLTIAATGASDNLFVTATGSFYNVQDLKTFSFGIEGRAVVTKVRECAIQVTSGPTGGYLLASHTGAFSSVRVPVGGMMHWREYTSGVTGNNVEFVSNPTGTYSVDITLIGVGQYTGIP